jgi:signal transduction histidine kinase/transcriptional regulator with GAF, ATPase, and Fis domain
MEHRHDPCNFGIHPAVNKSTRFVYNNNMDPSVSISRPTAPRGLSRRLWLTQAGLLGYLFLALAAFVVMPYQAFQWMRNPYPGFLSGPGLFVLDVPKTSPAYAQGLRVGDRILAVNEQPVSETAELAAALSGQKQVQIAASGPRGRLSLSLEPQPFPVTRNFDWIYVPLLVGVVYLASGVWTFAIRRSRLSGQILVLSTVSAAVLAGGLFDLYTSQRLAALWVAALAMCTSATFSMGLLFPTEDPVGRRTIFIHPLFFILSLLCGLNTLLRLNGVLDTGGFLSALRLQLGLFSGAILFNAAWTLLRRARTVAAIERDQMRFAVLGAGASFGPLLIWLALSPLLGFSGYPNAFVILPMVIFPMSIGYTIQRYRLQQTDYVLSRGMLYGVLIVLVTTGYALLVTGAALVLGQYFGVFGPLVSGVILFILALAFNPLRERTQQAINAIFFRGQTAFQDRLQTFSGALTRSVELPAILRTLRQYVEESLQPSRLHIFVYDPLAEQYTPTTGLDGRLTSDLRFSMGSPFIGMLTGHRGPMVLPEQNTIPISLAMEKPRLSLLGAEVYIPLPGRERMAGWVGLGQRLSGETYSVQELTFLEALCDQAALAIERAQVLANMEGRVRQMNVLARVAQGVNITLAMDDLLELIYAQTTSIIHADDFRIMLYDRALDTFQHIFYLENDERLTDEENKVVPSGQTLEQLVVGQRKSMRTDDYNREAQRNSISLPRPGVVAWMGVPLNAGAETIGALSLASRDPRVDYSNEQLILAQSIADQVAGAIVKARLLQETERRALQLTTLNEVTRQLTSTLELEPLLQNILQSAVDILSCEAGSLLLVDETTDELVFRVVVSPVASDLVNRRLPAGVGVVGKSVKSKQPIIVNDVTRFPEWFSRTDKQTGFVTRALLVIPFMVKDRTIGAIEVINKKDVSPFSQDDQDLLAAFAAQAAVAIENARLYTMTDQALAARVEELSVMQRIDRELNTSLESSAAMGITLEWAMRQTGAQAGLIGTLEESRVRVMASQGYQDEIVHFEGLLPLDHLGLSEIIHEPAPMRRSMVSGSQGQRLMVDARSQAVVPIRRETETIGLIFLESYSPTTLDDDALAFLVRLSDHAAVSIFNAQLYTAVRNANLAKSEFVSFVAHELKNPMTSVKGYTELLAAGAVGSISDAQAGFLNTIRSNIERMNTLVSDLNDMSKIEVGRLRLDFKPIVLLDVVESVVRSTRRQIDEKLQKLNLEIPSDLSPAWADRTRLEQVLVNLVSNAHKYTQNEGEITISAEKAQNQWDPSGAPEVLHICVRDSGIGISEEDQKKIFQKFFRSEDPKTREAPGTGLGLNITKSLVEMQGGQIWFESVFRQGTTFHFTVPISSQ